MEATDVEESEAEKYLNLSQNNPKAAIVMIETNCEYIEAINLLDKFNGSIYKSVGHKLSN